MGRRDDTFLTDDAQADAALRRLLAHFGHPADVEPPPALVTQTLRMLPDESPVAAARRATLLRAVRVALWAVLLGIVVAVVGLGVWSMLGGGAQIALLFGDGGGGLSRVLLMLYLMTKPPLRTLGALGAPAIVAGASVLALAIGLWWWLLRRTPAYAYAENRP